MTATTTEPAAVVATWDVQLRCTCPACKEGIDLVQTRDFWDGKTLELLQRAKVVEATCPSCAHEFHATTDY